MCKPLMHADAQCVLDWRCVPETAAPCGELRRALLERGSPGGLSRSAAMCRPRSARRPAQTYLHKGNQEVHARPRARSLLLTDTASPACAFCQLERPHLLVRMSMLLLCNKFCTIG